MLIAPAYFWGMNDSTDPNSAKDPDADQAVLIDFGQTVDSKHPDAMQMLKNDIQTIRHFFVKQGLRTQSVDDAVHYITGM